MQRAGTPAFFYKISGRALLYSGYEGPVGHLQKRWSIAAATLSVVFAAAATCQAEDRFFDSDGVRIRYVDEGAGPPVVLIHGYLGNIERHWMNSGVFADLSRTHRVIALDCRGHGKSDKPTDVRAYGPEMGRDVIRLLNHLKIPRAHIVGYSMGAFIAGHLATTDADRFLSLTFAAYHPLRAWTAADEEEFEASARDLESDTPFRRLILAVSPADAPPGEQEIRKLSQSLLASNDAKALAAYNRGVRRLAVSDAQLAAIAVPALAIVGSDDPSVDGVRALTRVMPGLPVVVVDGAQHGGEQGVLRRPEFLSALRALLDGRQ